MRLNQPPRVLDIIDGLDAGGSEKILTDVIRVTGDRARHRVTTMYLESAHQVGPFVHAEELRSLGAFREPPRKAPGRGHPLAATARSVAKGSPIEPLARIVWTLATVVAPGTFRALREVRRFRPDVIHAHLYYGFACGLVLTRITGRPLVHTVPALFAQMEGGVSWMPQLYARSHHLVHSFFTDYPDELRRAGVPEQKIRLLPGAVDIASADAAFEGRARYRAELRAAHGIAADAPVALSVGRLHPSKGHDLAARAVAVAARGMPELQWVVLGEGAERARLTALVRELGIVGRTHLLGFVRDVLPWYAAADVYLRTPVIEAENLSSRQAMAMGLPAVGFDTGAASELMRVAGKGHLVPGGDVERFAAAITDVLTSADRGRALGLRGREYARRELGIARVVDQFIATYEQIVSSGRGRSSRAGIT